MSTDSAHRLREKVETAIRRQLPAVRLTRDEPLARHGTWRIGGPADLFAEPESREDLQGLIRAAHGAGYPWVVIGDGSNLLFADEGVRALVLRIGSRMAGLRIDDRDVFAEAGIWVPTLVLRTARAGLTGLEHMIGIPGTLGGLTCMNGGSKRQSVGTSITRIELVTSEGDAEDVLPETCGFAYRDSRFLHGRDIVTGVHLRLDRRAWPDNRRELRSILQSRRGKFPRKLPNCGSVFKNDPAVFAASGPPGFLLEQCGLKGRRQGDAEISRQHANFIVNLGQASARDILTLVRDMRDAVEARFGHRLATEVRYLDPAGVIRPVSEQLDRGTATT